VREQAEGIGVAFEVYQVLPFEFRELLPQAQSVSFREISADGPFARVAERRVAHVVCQAGSRHDGADFRQVALVKLGMEGEQELGRIVAQRTPHARHFQAVRQSVVHEDASRKGKHLGLVLQASEGSGENQPVVVALELRAVVLPHLVEFLQAEPFV